MNDAYREGYEACQKGLTLDDNPYRKDAEPRKQWEEGWEDARIAGDSARRSICSDK